MTLLVSNSIYAKKDLPVPTKALLEMSPDMVMLSAPFGCTHPPPPSHPFCFSRKGGMDIARSDIMKLKVS